ncbi:MAG: phospholipase D-like domain-containing protein [Verrucomicrobiota bacterium]|jgi:phosphatidylserine/phosphatidylglycerophosphate/cardiolipin synthase-like enzyme
MQNVFWLPLHTSPKNARFWRYAGKKKKPLTLYARHDHTGPVHPDIFDWFFSKSKQSANYEIRLIRGIFHPKIIWWKKVGAYIGSANLTDAAWFRNYEAGIFLTEEEIIEAGFHSDLDDYFDEIHQASHVVTEEIAKQIKEIVFKGFGPADYKFEKEFNKSCPIPELPSLISITRVPSSERKKGKFLNEWSQTLQYDVTIHSG